ncbi:MAG: CAP domain-containing protein [bacterium]
MAVRVKEQRSALPLVLAIAGALFAAFALMFGADKRAEAVTNCSVTHDANDSEELAFLGSINTYRATNGLGALTLSTNLNRAAAWMAQDLADNNYFSHTDSLGRSPYSRAIDCGYPSGAGENLAAGTNWATAATAMTAWQNSPGHNANMLGTYYQQIGIARYYKAGSQYGWYWATDFGSTNDGTGGGGAGNPTPTNTPTRTATPANTSTPTSPAATSTPTSAVPTSTPTSPASTSTPTVPAATSTPTQASGGNNSPTPTTSTPTQAPATNTPTPGATSTPTPSATNAATPGPGNSLPLSPGANLVAWGGGNVDPAVAFAGNSTVAVVYEWDPATKTWKRYFPGLPGFLNNLKLMREGNAYWVIATTKSSLQMGR